MEGSPIYDLAIIGGGVNGCGIARDAAGRGLSVHLCEQGDLGGATSSASTKLFHGGLRYLEHYEFRLVRESLAEREVLLRAMPHISWPLRFVLPHHRGLRPAWMLRLGLWLYDHLGGRRLLPGTRTLDLRADVAGDPLKPEYRRAFEYSDCWVDDARLVVLNARDAAGRGAKIAPRTRCVGAERMADGWTLTLDGRTSGARTTVRARVLVNAAGPWVGEVARGVVKRNDARPVRLVRGSHIVVPRLFAHDRAYIFQQSDGRVIFALPYEGDFTLIGTTECEHDADPGSARCSDEEISYLCDAASEYFAAPVRPGDVVWTYSGVRPLVDDGTTSASAATRDYVLDLDRSAAPLLTVLGGKITTYRRLAEAALAKLTPFFPAAGPAWTAGASLPGGDFPVDGVGALAAELRDAHPFLSEAWSLRLVHAYGTEAQAILSNARSAGDLGRDFGHGLTEAELRWLIEREWAETAEDVLWRRSKLGLRLDRSQRAALADWMAGATGASGA